MPHEGKMSWKTHVPMFSDLSGIRSEGKCAQLGKPQNQSPPVHRTGPHFAVVKAVRSWGITYSQPWSF